MLNKKLTPLIIILFLINAAMAIAYELSEYPNLFRQGEKINVTAVVGDKSTSLNVLAVSSIYLSLKPREDTIIQTRLSSEITDIKQNIISIGNPCVNNITDAIMSSPKPCDKDFPKGKAFIKLIENGGYRYIIVAGYSDVGTRKAADVLANYNYYSLKGNEFVVDVDNELTAAAIIGQKEEEKNFEKQINAGTVQNVDAESVNNIEKMPQARNYTQEIEDDQTGDSSNEAAKEEPAAINGPNGQSEIKIEEIGEGKDSFIARFFKLLINLFR